MDRSIANSHSEAAKIYLTKIRLYSKPMCLGSNERSKKVQEGPSDPTSIFLVKQKSGRGRADLKYAGIKKFLSFMCTLVVEKMEKGKGPYKALVPYDERYIWAVQPTKGK